MGGTVSRVDAALSFVRRGYRFTERAWGGSTARARRLRFLGRPAVLVRGASGVQFFYDEHLVARHGAMPMIVQEVLFGHGSVHSLDGAAHRHRKAAFVGVLYEDAMVRRLSPMLEQEWSRQRDAWVSGAEDSAYDAAVAVLGRTIMRWAGLPGTPAAMTRWSVRLARIVDGFGTPYSPVFVQAVLDRLWSDRHARKLIDATRQGRLHPAEDTALYAWSWHRDEAGALLPSRLAGVELQNSLRPMIAVARFVAFAAKELAERPELRQRVAEETALRGALVGGPEATTFAQEVRRTAPFVPLLPGWVIADAEIDGIRLSAGDRILLDILGTDTDHEEWQDAKSFAPERFAGVDYESVEAFIPQGGGEVSHGHRCPGEKLVIAGLSAAIAVLSDPKLKIDAHGLAVDLRRLPTMPRSGGRVHPRGGCPVH